MCDRGCSLAVPPAGLGWQSECTLHLKDRFEVVLGGVV